MKTFKVKIDRKALSDIANRMFDDVPRDYWTFAKVVDNPKLLNLVASLGALEAWLKEQHCEPDFEVCLGE